MVEQIAIVKMSKSLVSKPKEKSVLINETNDTKENRTRGA